MRGLLLAAALIVAAGTAFAESLTPGEPVTVRSNFCRHKESAPAILAAYETYGVQASDIIMRRFVQSDECIVALSREIIPVELIYETADKYARIIKVEHPEKPGEFIYMLTVKYRIGGPDT